MKTRLILMKIVAEHEQLRILKKSTSDTFKKNTE